MSEEAVIDVEGIEVEEGATVASLATVQPANALVRSAASVEEVEQAFHDYQQLCVALLNEDDVQRIQGKTFRKKSAWRKLAVAFGVSCEVRERLYDRDDQNRITRAEVVVRAVAPNGRYMDGLGVCDISERKFSKPNHDIPATAMTRATNRACADLFGMGEVSAEELMDDGTHNGRNNVRALRDRAPAVDLLGYASEADLKEQMQALIDAVGALPAEYRERFKTTRKAAKIGWPVPQAQMEQARTIVTALHDECVTSEEPF